MDVTVIDYVPSTHVELSEMLCCPVDCEHSPNPPFEKGVVLFGSLKWREGGLENLKIKGAPFKVRPPNFLRGVGLS